MSILPNTNTQQTKVRSFLRSIHRQHFPPLARQHGLRQVLEFCALSKGLRIWHWPVYNRDDLAVLRDPSLLNCRVAPSDLETYRRYHQLLNPCCFCAFLDGVPYTESHVGIALAEETAQDGKQGLYVAECASGRCGYSGLRLKKYGRRGCALTYEESRTLHGVEAKVAQTCRKPIEAFQTALGPVANTAAPNTEDWMTKLIQHLNLARRRGCMTKRPKLSTSPRTRVPVFDVIDLTQDEVPVFDVIDLTQDEIPVFDVVDLTQDVGLALEVTG
ncbi:hypothetical protein BKA70DRAFT_1237637 [Coprinopsis sp. MPI-PUGE-AT-0042]|nr:hypothetical protein BKA70DRAFT_1237637 [Coprinopsis sp. MPI-PUGE-AT-0042]